MAYSESLAERVRHRLSGRRDVAEKKMFGGLGFLLDGNMCVAIWKSSLIARLGPEQAQTALKQPYVGEFDVTGRPMRGWVMIAAEGLDTERELVGWIEQAVEFAQQLPSKSHEQLRSGSRGRARRSR